MRRLECVVANPFPDKNRHLQVASFLKDLFPSDRTGKPRGHDINGAFAARSDLREFKSGLKALS